MGDLLGSLIWGAKSGQYCVIGGGSLQVGHSHFGQGGGRSGVVRPPHGRKKNDGFWPLRWPNQPQGPKPIYFLFSLFCHGVVWPPQTGQWVAQPPGIFSFFFLFSFFLSFLKNFFNCFFNFIILI